MAAETKSVGVVASIQAHPVLRHFAILRLSELFQLVKSTFAAWSDDNVPRLGAALAYYTALSLAPLIVVVLAVAGLAFGKQAVQGELVWQIQSTVGKDGAVFIQQLIQSASHQRSGVIATVLALFTLFFGATTCVVELTDALNTIWHVPPKNREGGFRAMIHFLRQRFISFAMVLGVGFLLLVSLVVSAWLAALGRFFGQILPVSEATLHAINFVISFFVITFLFALIYKLLPNVRLEWSDVAIGAAVTSLLFSLGKLLLGLYLGKSTLASTYGAAGSFVIVLVWVYYSAQIFFLGAEFTRIYTLQFGSRLTAKLTLAPENPDAKLFVEQTAVH
jgi:membrane protein